MNLRPRVCALACLVALVAFGHLRAQPSPQSQALYEQAWELYQQGPAKADRIVDLLEKSIDADPANMQARYLLGVTYFGTSRFAEALGAFDRAIELNDENETINPEIRFYRARALFELGRCDEARRSLEALWAFWQDRGRQQQRFEEFSQVVEQTCGTSEEPRASASGASRLWRSLQIVQARASGSLDDHLLIPLEFKAFAALEDDSDLGPFVRYAQSMRAEALFVILPADPSSNPSYAVVWDLNGRVSYSSTPRLGAESLAELSRAVIEVEEKTAQSRPADVRPIVLTSDGGETVPAFVLGAGVESSSQR